MLFKKIKKLNFKKFYNLLVQNFFNYNNIVVVIALILAIGWTWSSIGAMQRNFDLENELAKKNNQLKLLELETKTIEFQKKYHQTDEFQKIELKRRFNLAESGEHLVILPENSNQIKQKHQSSLSPAIDQPTKQSSTTSNLRQWLNFLLSGKNSSLQ